MKHNLLAAITICLATLLASSAAQADPSQTFPNEILGFRFGSTVQEANRVCPLFAEPGSTLLECDNPETFLFFSDGRLVGIGLWRAGGASLIPTLIKAYGGPDEFWSWNQAKHRWIRGNGFSRTGKSLVKWYLNGGMIIVDREPKLEVTSFFYAGAPQST